jgi:hypothetical protein
MAPTLALTRSWPKPMSLMSRSRRTPCRAPCQAHRGLVARRSMCSKVAPIVEYATPNRANPAAAKATDCVQGLHPGQPLWPSVHSGLANPRLEQSQMSITEHTARSGTGLRESLVGPGPRVV